MKTSREKDKKGSYNTIYPCGASSLPRWTDAPTEVDRLRDAKQMQMCRAVEVGLLRSGEVCDGQ